ncbi:hypothetical protein CTAYLR_010151 [Chrysophaeum taylorii]|uniref:FAD-binding domain-containing protein n=1 Tax=Chrysophaeum taylorii TaxID=2483200 RepID=A0AAD7XQW3_9STRA|nr:hypothetical protein CTAYLR_010151 [Chrysophaeum taylorii]
MLRRWLSSQDVVVCGGGPAGLTVAALLGRWGVKCTVVEPLVAPSAHPRAHVLGARTMEILREVGVEASILKEAPELDLWRRFRYCDAVDGEDLGVADHGTSSGLRNLRETSASGVAHVSQPKVEAALRDRIASYPSVTALYGRRATRVREDGAVELDDGSELSGRFVVGADGPRGVVRGVVARDDVADADLEDTLGVSLRASAPPLQHFVSIHFESPELGARLAARPAMLYFVFNPHTASVVVAHDLVRGVFNLQAPVFPPLDAPLGDLLAPSSVDAAVRVCLRRLPSDLRVHAPKLWGMRARLEPTFSRGNKVFLVGDAAHELPPSGGFGLNCAIQDAHNLSWKLRREDWLETYDVERRPATAAALAVAVDNWRRGLLAPQALGAPPAALDVARNTVAIASLFGERARKTTRAAVRAATGLGFRAAFSSPRTSSLRDLLRARRDLPLFFPRVDLGTRYDGASPLRAARDALRNARHHLGAEPYAPVFHPGHRLPHFWLRRDPPTASLDAVADVAKQRPNFSLLVLGDADSDSLLDIFADAAARLRPQAVDVLDARPADPAALKDSLHGVTPPVAVLVRPDGIVAHVWDVPPPSSMGIDLRSTISPARPPPRTSGRESMKINQSMI